VQQVVEEGDSVHKPTSMKKTPFSDLEMASVSSMDFDEEEARLAEIAEMEHAEKNADVMAVLAVPRPRPPRMSMVPFCYGGICGFGGLFMIYGAAANLGPEQTKLWLITSVSALGLKVCFSEPLKIIGSTVFLQIAENLESSVLGDIAAFMAGDDDEIG
jgi:hypothetical protein